MPKDAYWFRHDANARNDPKMCRLLMVGGQAAKGCFWDLVEILRESDNYKILLEDLPGIAFACRFPDGVVEKIIDCGLLQKDDRYLWSDSLLRRMAHLDDIREKRRVAGAMGGRPIKQKEPKPEHQKSNCKPNANQLKSKKKRSDLSRSDLSRSDLKEPFDQFWAAYPRKIGKKKAQMAFTKASKDGLPKIDRLIEIIESQKKGADWLKDGGQFIPHPTTWLNQGRWDDEITLPGSPGCPRIDANKKQLTPGEQKTERNQQAIEAFRSKYVK